jgi:hypothetical protein
MRPIITRTFTKTFEREDEAQDYADSISFGEPYEGRPVLSVSVYAEGRGPSEKWVVGIDCGDAAKE